MTKESLQYATHLGINVDDNGAPITKEYAEQRVAALLKKHKTMEQDANAVRNFLMEEHLAILEDNQLLPQDRIDHLRNGTSDRSDVVWEHYVPMLVKDDMFEEVGLGSKTYMADSKGPTGLYELGVGGKDFGRDDRYDPIGMMMLTAAANNKFALNNKVKREFAKMVDEFNPNDFGIKRGLRGQKLVGREDDGEIEMQTQIGEQQMDDKEKGTRVEFIGTDGQVYTIVGLNPAARNSLIFKSMLADGDSMDGKIVVEFLRRLNNFWRAGITSLNVFFGIGQLLPDALDGGINTIYELQNITQVSKPKLAASYAKNYAKTVAFFTGDAVKALAGIENDNELAQAYREFYQYGGKMAWRKLGGERLKAYNDLTRQIEIAQKNGQALPVATAKKVLASLEAINDSMENFARFAAYLTAKQYGLSLTESAALARESTVDFGAKGRSTAYKYAKLLFLFFGPAVKGLERSVRTLTMGGPAGAITYMGGFAAASAVARMLVYSFADDEEELDRIVNDKYVNQNRFRVPTVVDGNKYPFSVKMPYSPIRIAHSIGIGMVDVFNEKRTVGDIGVDVMSGLQTLLDPVSGTSSLTNYIPNVFRSIFQTNFNSDYAGRPIISPYILLNSNFKKDQYDKGTGLAYVRMAEWAYDNLNLDISPAMTEYFIDQSLNLPAIRKPMQSIEEWIYYVSGERPTPDIFKPLYAEGVEDKPLNRNRLVGPLSAFYYESKDEVSDLINFFEFSDKRSRMRDITEKQFDYLLRSSEMMWQNEMVKWSTIKKNLDKLKEKYPEDANGNQLNWDSHIKRLQDKNTKRNAIRKSLR